MNRRESRMNKEPGEIEGEGQGEREGGERPRE